MTPDDFRRIALALNGVVESAHMGHPDFRAGGQIFATLHGDHRSGMVKLSPGQQEQFIDGHPTVFTPESGAWGRAGCTRVRLDAADEETVGEAMTLAWQEVTSREKAKGKTLKAKAKGKSQNAKPEARGVKGKR
jgi:hypothetical protein